MKVEIEKATVVTCPSTLVTVNHGDANCLSSAPDVASWFLGPAAGQVWGHLQL